MKISVLMLSSLMLSAGIAAAQAPVPTKVGIIHMQNAILGTKEGQKALQDLEARSAPKKKDFERRQAEIVSKQEQLNKSSNVTGEDAKQKLMRDIDTAKKAFTRDLDDAQADLDQENQKIVNEIGGRLIQTLDKYGRDNGYALILDVSNAQAQTVMFAANGIDVTQDVIALYDKNAPSTVPTGVSKPAPTPGAARPPVSAAPAAPKPTAPAATKPAGVK